MVSGNSGLGTQGHDPAQGRLPTDSVAVTPGIRGTENRPGFRVDLDHHFAARRLPIADNAEHVAATRQAASNFFGKTALEDYLVIASMGHRRLRGILRVTPARRLHSFDHSHAKVQYMGNHL